MPDGAQTPRARRGRRSGRQPDFLRLDDRLLLAAQPIVDVQAGEAPIGGQATVTVTFDNVPDSAPGSEVGFAPYVDLILPQNGADGAGPGDVPANDGASFVSASYLGLPLQATVLEFDAAGEAIHPFARDASGNPLVVRAADYGAGPGDQFVTFQLPFGSFVPEQPAAAISVTLDVSPLADLGTPLPVTAVGGFAFGRDALNNPTADPPVRGPAATDPVVPTLLTVTKTYDGPEGETATGPSFPRSFTISFDLATGQVVTNASLLDTLPDGIVLTGPPIVAGAAGTATYDPVAHTVAVAFDGTITGIDGPEATVTIPFYVAETLVPGDPGTPVLGVDDGASRLLANDVSAQADWTPLDPRDPTQTVIVDPPGPEAVFTAKSVAIQKTQAVVIDANAPGLGPGDTVEYVIEGQISDYYTFRDLVLTDLMSDGQALIAGSARLDVTEAGSTLGSGAFDPANITATRDAGTGVTTILYLIGDQLVTAGAPDGDLTGGEVAALPTTFRLTYRALVENTFLATGDPLTQGDSVGNSVAVAGGVVNGGIVTGENGDNSASSGTIATGGVTKEVYALNGTILPPGTPVAIGSGDLVTFRLTYALPQTLTAELVLRDFLPLPVFTVAGLSLGFEDVVSPDAPAVNIIKWGPDAGDFDALLTAAPLLSFDVASNSLTLVFAGLNPAVPQPSVADILFTLEVADEPFGDGLLLTNQVQATETSTQGGTVESTALRQVTLTEPVLRVTKGIVATSSGDGTFTPGAVGPVPFTAPGTPGVRFTGEINSSNLQLVPVDSDLAGIDAGDLVTHAIIIENIGRGINGAFDIALTDDVPQGYRTPAGGLNLQVTDGAGRALPFVFLGDLDTLNGTLQLIDPPGTGQGALAPFAATGGANILVITYDLEVTEEAEPRDQLTNLSEIANYAALEGGVDRVPNTQEQTSDVATARIADPGFVKTAVETSVAETGLSAGDPALFDLTIGETVTFELVATLGEGRIQGLEITDTLPVSAGRLDYVSAAVVGIGANLFVRNADGSAGAALGAPTITVTGNVVRFDFADDILNLADNVVTDADRIVLRVVAVAADAPTNLAGREVENIGVLGFVAGGATATIEDSASVEIVEPDLALTKVADRSTVQGNDIVTYTVDLASVSAPFAGPAFDLTLTDPLLPGALTLLAGSAALVAAPSGATIAEAGGVVTVTLPTLLPGEAVRFTYQARVEPTVVAGTVLPNTVAATADSFPGTPPLGVQRAYDLEASASVRVPGDGIVKTVSAADTSLPETGSDRFDAGRPDLAIGEEVTYRITVIFPEAVSLGVTVRDLLPGAVSAPAANAGTFEFLSAAIVRVGASLTVTGLGTPPAASDLSGDGILDTVVFDLGDVTNTPDGVFDAGDEIEITVTARVRDALANRAGQAPVNTAVVDFGTGTASATALVDIVEPSVGIDKTASASSGDAGDRVTYEVTLPADQADSGPAFDVVATDVLPDGLEIDVATLRFAGPVPTGGTIGYDPSTRTITVTLPVYRPEDPAVAFTYDAIVADDVRPAQVLTNTASVVFDSHPGDPGTEYQRGYGPVTDTETFVVDLPDITKAVSDTDIPETQIARLQPLVTDVAIGETVSFLITLRLPEAETDLVITDFLPRAEGSPPVAGDMAWVGSRIVSIGGNIQLLSPGAPGPGDQGVVSDPNGDGILDTIRWDFGRVRNLADNVEDDEDLIVLEVVAIVPDLPTNQPADVLVNLAQAQYRKADGSTALVVATEPVEIVAPELLIDKTASVPSGDAGDIVTYTVTVAHDAALSTSEAFALVVTDALAPGLELVVGSVTAALSGGGAGTIAIGRGNAAGDTGVEVSLSQLANRLLLPDDVLTITYQARIADSVRPGQTILNTADLGWQSAPAGFPEARPDTARDDASIAIVFPDAFEKTIIATSLPETGDAAFDPALTDLAVGETVTYALRVTLGEGTQRVLVEDLLPAGLDFVAGEVVSIGGAISGALLGIGAAPTVSGGAIAFDFGDDVVNAGNNLPDDGVIVVQVTARVRDVPGNAAGTVLTNAARFTTDDAVLTDAVPVEVVEPEVAIVKDASIASGDAGDLVTFTVTVAQQPGATGPLYDLVVEDLLPAGHVLVAGSAAATRGTVTEGPGGLVRLSLAGAALLPADDPGTAGIDESRIVLTYAARLADAVQPGEVVTNTASFTGGSAPTGTPELRGQAGSDDAAILVVMPVALEKIVLDTSLPESGTGQFDPALTDLAVGETVTYRLTATLSEGTQTLVIEDTLPDGLELLSSRVAAVGAGLPGTLLGVANSGTGQQLRFDFGTVVNAGDNLAGDDSVVIEVTARVRDVPSNIAGAALTNAAAVTITAPADPTRPGGTETAADSVTVEIVEPVLAIDKAAPAGFLYPGDALTYIVQLTHDPGSTAAAYDIALTDLLADPWLDLVAGSVTTTLGSIALGNAPGDATIRVDIPVLTIGQTVTVTYVARLSTAAPAGVTVANTATADFDSAADLGGPPVGRPGSVTDGTATPGAPGLEKAIVATSIPETGSDQFDPTLPDLAVGESLTYRLTITLPQGTTEALVLSDLLPDGLTPLAARVTAVGAGLAAGAPTISIIGPSVTLDFGTVVNASGAAIGAEDRILVEIDAVVADIPAVAAGATLVNAAALGFVIDGRGGSLTDSAPAEVVEPELAITKTVDRTTGDAGDVFTYTVTIAHAPGSTSAAFDLALEDVLDPVLAPLSAGASAGTSAIAGNTIRLTLDRLLLTDAPVVLTYSVAFRDAVEPGQVVGNTAALAWDSNPGPGGRPDTGAASAADLLAVFDLALDKAIVATSLPETGSGAFDPALPDLAVGETVTYRLTATLAEGTQTLLIEDTLPDGLERIASSVTAVGAGLPAGLLAVADTGTGQAVRFDFGTVVNTGNNLTGDGTVTIEVVARVRDTAGNVAGAVLTNAAAATITAPTDPARPGGTLTDAAAVSAEVVEPELLITKGVDGRSGDAGDVFTYTVTIAHAPGSTSAAFDLVLADPLDPRLVLVDAVSTVGTPTVSGNTLGLALPVLLTTDAPVTVTYRVRFADAVEPGQVIGNTAALAWDSSGGPGGRPDAASASAPDLAVLLDLALEKSIVATSLPETGSNAFDPARTDLAIGETVTYELVARLSEGTQTLVIVDDLPDGLLPLAGQAVVVSTGAAITAGAGGTLAPMAVFAGQRVTFDFGTLVNAGDNLSNADDLVVVRIAARVLDAPGNTEGRVVENTALATIASPSAPGVPGGTVTDGAAIAAEIVLPAIAIDKQVDRAGGDAGDVFAYTLTIAPVAGATGPGYDLRIEDALPATLRAVPGSVTTTLGTASLVGNTILVTIPVLLPGDAPVIVGYRAAFTDAIEPGQVVPNQATLAYSSAPEEGRGFADEAAASVRGVFSLALDKQVVATSLPETGTGFFDPTLADIAAGETVTWRIAATIAEGTQRLVITDRLPEGLVAESARLVSLGPGITAGAPSIALAAGSVAFDFGTVVNAGDNIGDDVVVVEVTARLGPGPAAGSLLLNRADATVAAPTDPGAPGGTLTANAGAAVEAVAAILAIDKQATPATVVVGQTIAYTVILAQRPGSTAPAYAVLVTDDLAGGTLELVAGSVLASAGTIELGNGAGDATVRVSLAVLLPGEALTVTYNARAITVPIPDGVAPNTAIFASTSAPGLLPPGFARPDGGQDEASVQVVSSAVTEPGGSLIGAAAEEALRRLAFAPLRLPAILAGTAQPGATVTLALLDAEGGPVASGGVIADMGGNWIARAPSESFAPRFDTLAFGALREAVGRLPDVFLAEPVVPPIPPPVIGIAPYTVLATGTPAISDLFGLGRETVSVTFGGALQPGGLFTGVAGGTNAVGGLGGVPAEVTAGLAALTQPLGLAWNRFAIGFAEQQVAAGVAGR